MAQRNNLKSNIWQHFERQENSYEAKCRYCHKLLTFTSGSSSNLKRHLSRKHPTVPLTTRTTENLQDSSTPASSSNVTSNTPGTSSGSSMTSVPISLPNTMDRYIKKPLPVNTKQEIDKKLIAMIFSGYHPISIVEEPGFQDFIKTLNTSYDLPDRKTVSHALIPSMYLETLSKVKSKISSAKSVSLTMDGWTNINNTSFYAVTSHFIDDDAHLCSFLLECSEFSISHTGQNIAQWLKTVLSNFGIQDKIIAIVTDNASNMKSTADSAKISHVPCFAHCLNLIVQEGIEKSIKPTVDEVKSIVRHFKKGSKATKKLEEMQKNLKCQVLKLKQDVATRWNSTNDMLARFLKNKEPLLSCLAILNIHSKLQEKDWVIMEQAISVLELFNLATTEVSAEKTVTLSKMGVICRILIAELRKTQSDPNLIEEVRILVQTLLKKTLERLRHVKDNDIVVEAIFLDPRYKQEGFMEDAELFKKKRTKEEYK
ncbi:E3 SUMO-protein ligase ZBED1-like [Anopheles funestus]|uniref:E3 SUMO-protein ligase ZBED1-like n=1 Tax=Anopheles funestus TaxID=62324 RepID=UPI0020C72D07|nr:E3 SUMO-protein ligase ZBED1-like [Anopheles funestus]